MRTKRHKPTAVKKANGNPGQRRLNEDEPTPSGTPECPDWLTDGPKAEWTLLCDKLCSLGILTEIDATVFAVYCQCLYDYNTLLKQVRDEGIKTEGKNGFLTKNPAVVVMKDHRDGLMKAMVEIGLTPSSRSVLIAKKRKDKKDLDTFAASKPKASDLRIAK